MRILLVAATEAELCGEPGLPCGVGPVEAAAATARSLAFDRPEGVLHVGLAWFLGSHFGVTGIVAAGVASHGLVFSALAWKPFAQATGTTEISLLSDVLAPWATRMAPMLIVALLVQRLAGTPPLPVTIATGALVAATVLFYMRPLYIEFGPVRTLYERVLRSWRAALGGAHP